MIPRDNGTRVLVMGYRQGICDALFRLNIPYAVWAEKEVKSSRKILHLLVQKFPRTRQQIAKVLLSFTDVGPFSHVIAGSESSVYCASVARRILSARQSNNSAALRCNDKLHMKSYLRDKQIPMTDFIAGEEVEDYSSVIEQLGIPVVIKARKESGGRSIELAETADQIARLAKRTRIMERFIKAPEASIETFINNGEILFTSTTQYYLKKHINVVPALPQAIPEEALIALNKRVLAALNIKWGITHMEVYLSDEGLLFGEIALRPPGGYIMELISKSYGFSAWDALVHIELDYPFSFPEAPLSYSAASIIHPGAGKIEQISNWDEVSQLPSVFKSKLKVLPGMTIKDRNGVGEDAGYLLLSNINPE
ncbi:ATP-grasp domain-containing protein, partial [Psychromonas sp.]|nr:ATP-grasp domain-containing protein [Psychromonas sp.]